MASLAQTIKAGNQETVGLGNELAAKQNFIDQAFSGIKKPATAKPPQSTLESGERINPNARYGDRKGEKRINTSDMVKPLGSFKRGGKVPKTGAYILHKDEKVVPAEQAKKEDKMATPFDMITGGKKKSPKVIHHHEYHKTHNGKHVVTHKHHGTDHQDEQHMFEKFSDAADHMENNPPQPEPEPAPAEGAPAAAPAAGAAPAAAATPGM